MLEEIGFDYKVIKVDINNGEQFKDEFKKISPLSKIPVIIDHNNKKTVFERHRHRYEFNSSYKKQIESSGMTATGVNPKTGLIEIIELNNHPWFVGVQYHPEYKSTVANPHPLFKAFVKASLNYKLSK